MLFRTHQFKTRNISGGNYLCQSGCRWQARRTSSLSSSSVPVKSFTSLDEMSSISTAIMISVSYINCNENHSLKIMAHLALAGKYQGKVSPREKGKVKSFGIIKRSKVILKQFIERRKGNERQTNIRVWGFVLEEDIEAAIPITPALIGFILLLHFRFLWTFSSDVKPLG